MPIILLSLFSRRGFSADGAERNVGDKTLSVVAAFRCNFHAGTVDIKALGDCADDIVLQEIEHFRCDAAAVNFDGDLEARLGNLRARGALSEKGIEPTHAPPPPLGPRNQPCMRLNKPALSSKTGKGISSPMSRW